MTATDQHTANGAQRLPASPAQPGLWFDSIYGADPTAYNQPLVLRLGIRLEHEYLVAALDLVHREHAALRTTFEMDADGELRQVVHRELAPEVDARDHPDDDADAWIAEQVAEIACAAFDLRAGPLARVRHLRLGDDRSVLVFNIHHTVFDGMSWKPYLTELEAAYTALRRGEEPARGDRRQAIEAYERWSELSSEAGTLRYWRDKLTNAPAAAPLGLPAEGPARHVTRELKLDARLSARVREFCAAEGVTTSMFFVALSFVLLHRQTGEDDVLLGLPVSVRGTGDAEVLAHLTNTVVLQQHFDGNSSARDVLRAVKREVLEALRHRHAPLEAVLAELRAAGGSQDGALFNVMVTVMPAAARRLDLPDWGVQTWEHEPGGAKYDLAVLVDETPDHFTLVVEHATAAADGEEFTAFLAQRLETLLDSVLHDPDERVDDLRWMSDDERRAIAELCARRTDAPELGTELTADLFAASAAAAGRDPAIRVDGATTTYAELAERADEVAACLVDKGVRDGQPVAVLMRPGLDLITTVIGILRAGGAYVTLDAEQPWERIEFTLTDSGATILVRDPDIETASLPADLDVLSLAEMNTALATFEEPRKTPEDTAYIVYTSGSTGRPKGVRLPEITLANLVHNQAIFTSDRRMRTLQYMPPAFDVFAIEVFGSLCNGGTLVIPPAHARTDFEALVQLLAEERVERAYLPYVTLRELAAVLRTSEVELPDLREVYVTGERLVITGDVRAMFRRNPNARLINAYGPSEAHLCSWEALPADPDGWPTIPSIGRVVAGVDAYVLDADSAGADRPAPFGVEGELCVAGPVISPGYIGLPDKTREAMVPDPFVDGQWMYRTGDIVVLDPAGRLHYRGRKDDQVKIRGYRVEPGEVEAALERELDVDAAAVIVVSDGGDRALRAFVQSAEEPPADWRARVGAVLPGYMIPRQVTRVDTIPVTPNGKTDRRALAELPVESAPDPGEHADVAWTDSERTMAELWSEVLGHRPATPEDDFFVLGGHSLLAARLHRLVKRRFHTDVALSTMLSTPTPRGMIKSLADRNAAAAPDLRADARLDDLVVGERYEPENGTVFLTGATGFLGSHLLDELQRTGHRVRCLVRGETVADARDRLRRTFRKFALDPSGLDEVEVVLGDLDEPGFGLGNYYEALARDVSEVYHAAAHINFVVPYHTVKCTNVDGLRHLLEFCALNRTPLRLISTLGVFPPDSTSGRVGEDTVPGDPASLGIGYSQSKWVAEQLALQARAAGLPVTVHRVGRIAGHRRTGACRHDDFFWLQMKGFALLGCYPEDIAETPAIDLLPVDYVARAIIRLSEDKPDNENWHLYHPDGLTWPVILETIRDEGYATDPTSGSEWMAALERQAAETDDERRGLGPLVPLMREGVMRLGAHSFDNEKSRRALADVGCPYPQADPGWIHRMFDYFRAVGAIAQPDGRTHGGDHND
ncbi:amino acid adenylation domain-containing protein/thioester reductase-like protein [Nocardia tenerifensis]|uniref:Amino acid adenylation domain-containing protein/thioester reductase-like protein n=1 Tax=Nocardia tenerifensis TaxID=228006 RepID=A0A318JTP6_9NOCA|nr:non-ribosomal peptide synthetase [Nocardia tenerifensis]PXX54767.1 amino acid adenylation domain-containing protein/thioester reductase-like protein [Nocardia tenerifensis]